MKYDKKEFKKKAEVRTNKLQKILKELSNQLIIDIEKLDKIIDSWKENLYSYSAYNIFSANIQLMKIKGKPMTALNSYRRWQKEKRYVKKGEKALFILAPITYKKEDPEELEDMEEVITCFRSVPVFDISQTEGEALNYTKSNNKLISKTNIKFNDLIKYSPIPVFLDNIHGRGWTDGERICINKESNNQNRICSLFHELGHYELHFTEDGKNKSNNIKELEAEATSYCLSRLIGLENDTAGAYLKAWKGTNEKLDKSGLEIIKTADKISRYLLKDIT